MQCFRRPADHHVVALGDSLTRMNSDPAWGILGSDSWFALGACQHRIDYGYNAGVYGNTTAQMLGRFDRDVARRDPSAVVILGGTNDLLNGEPPATTLDHLRQLVREAEALHVPVTIGTLPPIDVPTVDREVTSLNTQIVRMARAEDVRVADFYAAVALNGRYRASWSTDGVHPTRRAAEAMLRAYLDAQQ